MVIKNKAVKIFVILILSLVLQSFFALAATNLIIVSPATVTVGEQFEIEVYLNTPSNEAISAANIEITTMPASGSQGIFIFDESLPGSLFTQSVFDRPVGSTINSQYGVGFTSWEIFQQNNPGDTPFSGTEVFATFGVIAEQEGFVVIDIPRAIAYQNPLVSSAINLPPINQRTIAVQSAAQIIGGAALPGAQANLPGISNPGTSVGSINTGSGITSNVNTGTGGLGGGPGPTTGIVCGNNIIDQGESCDLGQLNGQTCATVVGTGYTGTLSCNSNCQFDTSLCLSSTTIGTPPTTTPTCIGTIPANAQLCPGDDTGLTRNTNNILSRGCSIINKCEYTCNAGYQVDNTASPQVCVPIPVQTLEGDVVPPGAPDGCVNIFDLAVIARNIDLTCTIPPPSLEGDIDGNGCVNIFDLAVIAQNVDLTC